MTLINNFKEAHKQFSKALKYLIDHDEELHKDLVKWEKIKNNFINKFEKPLDEAWMALNKEEKKSLASLYLHRKALQDPLVQKVISTFDAKIVKITTEGEEDEI